jgi:thioredoxin reductase (NADPH)
VLTIKPSPMIGLVVIFALLRPIRCDDEEEENGFGWGFGEEDDDDTPKPIEWDSVSVDDVIIIGSGPAGSTAALYLARAGYKPIVLHGPIPGGQLTYTSEIENYPGFQGTGPDLVKVMEEQAEKAGAVYQLQIIAKVNLSVYPFELESESNQGFKCKSLIVATGANARYLGLESEQHLRNRGVSACAVCDGALFTGQDVAVVGGGDTAIEEAIYLSKMCKTVKLIHRRSELRASKPMQDRLKKSNVTIVWDSIVSDVIGEQYVTGVQLKNVKSEELTVHNISALFVAIGRVPATALFAGQIDMDDDGYFVTGGTPSTKIPGVFVAGDCADKVFRQAITSAGTGCQAALLTEKFLAEKE